MSDNNSFLYMFNGDGEQNRYIRPHELCSNAKSAWPPTELGNEDGSTHFLNNYSIIFPPLGEDIAPPTNLLNLPCRGGSSALASEQLQRGQRRSLRDVTWAEAVRGQGLSVPPVWEIVETSRSSSLSAPHASPHQPTDALENTVASATPDLREVFHKKVLEKLKGSSDFSCAGEVYPGTHQTQDASQFSPHPFPYQDLPYTVQPPSYSAVHLCSSPSQLKQNCSCDVPLSSSSRNADGVWYWDANAPPFQPSAESDAFAHTFFPQCSPGQCPPEPSFCFKQPHSEADRGPSTSLCNWSLLQPQIPFSPQYVARLGKGLLIGGEDLQLAYVDALSSASSESLFTEASPVIIPIQYNFSMSQQINHPKLSWIHLERVSKNGLIGVSSVGLHLQTLFSTHESTSGITCFPLRDVSDRVSTAAWWLTRGRSGNWGLGTEQGWIYWIDEETMQLSGSLPPPNSLLSAGGFESRYRDALVCSIGRERHRYCDWFRDGDLSLEKPVHHVHTLPMSFGTLGGDIVLTDERMSRVASRFHVVEGPVLGLSLCGWDLVVTGGTERLSAAECGYLFQNAQNSQLTLSSLCHRTLSQRLRCVAAEHGWSTQLRAVDVRMMRHSAPSNALSPNGTATSSSIWDPDTCENTNPKSFFTALQQFKRSCSLNPEDKLQLVDIKKHPQLSHSVLSLASTGHILSIELQSSSAFGVRPLVLHRVPKYVKNSVPVMFDVPSYGSALPYGIVVLDITGNIFVSTASATTGFESQPLSMNAIHSHQRSSSICVKESQETGFRYFLNQSPPANIVPVQHLRLPQLRSRFLSEPQAVSETATFAAEPCAPPQYNVITPVRPSPLPMCAPSLDTIQRQTQINALAVPYSLDSEPSSTLQHTGRPTSYRSTFFRSFRVVPPTLTLQEWIKTRPPSEYRWLSSDAALCVIEQYIYKQRKGPFDRGSGMLETAGVLEFDPLREALWKRDVDRLCLSAADALIYAEANCALTTEERFSPTREASALLSDAEEDEGSSPRTADEHKEYHGALNGPDNTDTGVKRRSVYSRRSVLQLTSPHPLPDLPPTEWATCLTAADQRNLLYNAEACLALFNWAGPSGLEPSMRCPMVNAIVQVLRFVPGLHDFILRHYCEREACLACELGFLWHMLTLATNGKTGRACQAKNFIFALEKIPEARLCRILPQQYDLPGTAKKSAEPCSTELASVVGAFLPFLLQRLRRDLLMPTQDDDKHNSASGAAPDSPTADIIATLFGCGIRTTSTCVAKGHTATSDVLTRFVVKLRSGDDEKTNLDTQDCTLRVNDTTPLYPLSLSGKSYFGTLLENSLARTFLRATFCKGCGTPTLQKHKESVTQLPPILALDCGGISWKKAPSAEKLAAKLWLRQNEVPPDCLMTCLTANHYALPSILEYFNFWDIESVPGSAPWIAYELLGAVCLVKERIPIEPCSPKPATVTSPHTAPHLDQRNLKETLSITTPPLSASRVIMKDTLSSPYSAIPDHLIAHIRVPTTLLADELLQRGLKHRAQAITLSLQQKESPSVLSDQNAVAPHDTNVGNPSKSSCSVTLLSPSFSNRSSSTTPAAMSSHSHPKHFSSCAGTTSALATPCYQWITANDFVVTRTPEDQVLTPSTDWKETVCLFYVSSATLNELQATGQERRCNASLTSRCLSKNYGAPPVPCPIPHSFMAKHLNLSRHPLAPSVPHFKPLNDYEIQQIVQFGCLFSFDTEFVLLNRPTDLRDDALALARLSIVRAEGPLEGVPCLDCHVLLKEEPIDYLTKFSGLKPGDLDETHSSHWLTTRKSLYQNLRFFVDHRCTFIGHGLTKDFHIMNLYVPEAQLIDTAQLLRLPGQRILSLRFLASQLLGKTIQASDTGHDSIEDATVALQLYRHYQELCTQGILPLILKRLYAVGDRTNWSVNIPLPQKLRLFPGPSHDTSTQLYLHNISEH